MIHVNDPAFNEHLFRENFNMHTSTSPQYAMIASLDVARKQAVMEGYKLLSRTLALAQELRQQINSTGVFRVLELEDLLPDEVKSRRHPASTRPRSRWTSPTCGYTVEDLQQELFDALQHPGREVDLQHVDPAAHDRHTRAARCRDSTTR